MSKDFGLKIRLFRSATVLVLAFTLPGLLDRYGTANQSDITSSTWFLILVFIAFLTAFFWPTRPTTTENSTTKDQSNLKN
jgi:hypothetical protein